MTPDNSYRAAGVDAAAADAWLEALRARLPRIGGFAALFPLKPAIAGLEDPCLVACTDGVGTKVLVARVLNDFSTIGIDCVAMVLNDMVCCGARPLFFLDYLAVGKFDRAQADAILDGLRRGCEECGCEIIGGETAELPGLLVAGDFDVCGFGIGVVDRAKALDGTDAQAGDAIVGLPSNGIHSNGLSLARRVLSDYAKDRDTAAALLRPTRLYVRPVLDAMARVPVRSAAHITGGGLPGNLPRAFPRTLAARLDEASWTVPEIFRAIERRGAIPREEMYRTFNMGLGMCLVVAKEHADALVEALEPEGARVVGHLEAGDGTVRVGDLHFRD
jgi:phosphoribosylformylglycinamidine cyclo-ligase